MPNVDGHRMLTVWHNCGLTGILCEKFYQFLHKLYFESVLTVNFQSNTCKVIVLRGSAAQYKYIA